MPTLMVVETTELAEDSGQVGRFPRPQAGLPLARQVSSVREVLLLEVQVDVFDEEEK